MADLIETTVKSFTDGDKVTEITLNDEGPYVIRIRDLLNKCGIDIYNKYSYEEVNIYDEGVRESVIEFQEKNNLKVTGTVNNETLKTLVNIAANRTPDIIYAEEMEMASSDTITTNNPHYDSFFGKENTKTARKNNQDITIVLGENAVIKTIHNVYMRGVSTEYDTSGNPISEIYEFIGQDLTESSEINDGSKYE